MGSSFWSATAPPAFGLRSRFGMNTSISSRSYGATGKWRMPRVTDEPLIAKKLAMIETCVEDLQRLSRPDALAKDVREARFVERTLQIAIQAALDAASHI